MSNLEIREFSQAIINFINSSALPVEVKRLALSDIMHQLDSAANTILQNEIAERDRLANEEKEEQDNGTEQIVQPDRVGE